MFAMIQEHQVRDDEGPEVLEFRDEERKAKLAAETRRREAEGS